VSTGTHGQRRRASRRLSPDAIASRRVVVYMAQFGGADPIMPPIEVVPGWDYLVFSSREQRMPRPWKQHSIVPPRSASTPRLMNRWCKILSSRVLDGYDYSIYLDAHLQITGDLRPLLEEFIASDADCGLVRHPLSRNVDHEVERQVRVGRITREDYEENWPRQRAGHRSAGFNDDLGAYFAAVVLRRHGGPDLAAFEQAWWDDLRGGVTRDQVALPFALWRTGIRYQAFIIPWTLEPFFRKWQHLPRERRWARLVRYLDCRVRMMPWIRPILLVLRPRAALRSKLLRFRSGC
jgi:hypothetical protein